MIIDYIKIAAWAALLSAIGGAYYFFHAKPISDLENRVETLEALVEHRDIELSNLYVDLQRCKDDGDVVIFETYFEGLADANSTIDNSLTF